MTDIRTLLRVGDHVHHWNGDDGVVTEITPDLVTVSFAGYIGKFDEVWFRKFPDGLRSLSNGERDT